MNIDARKMAIGEQGRFCLILMEKILYELDKPYAKYSRCRDDIRRLRLELTELSKMTEWRNLYAKETK